MRLYEFISSERAVDIGVTERQVPIKKFHRGSSPHKLFMLFRFNIGAKCC